jgi:predicted nucleotidyltransferase
LIIAVICDAVSTLHGDVKAKIHGTFDEEDEYSEGTIQVNVREQVECIEEQVDELQRRQEQTMHTLEYLTKQLQAWNGDESQI